MSFKHTQRIVYFNLFSLYQPVAPNKNKEARKEKNCELVGKFLPKFVVFRFLLQMQQSMYE